MKIFGRSDPLPVGSQAPNFTLRTQNGAAVELSSLRGKNVILFFSPCDKQLIAVRDNWTKFEADKWLAITGNGRLRLARTPTGQDSRG